MKKLTRRQFTAAGIIAAMSLAGAGLKSCTPFASEENEPVSVYGPPEDFDPADNELTDVYGPPPEVEEDAFDVTENVVPALYGPPEVLADEAGDD